MRRPIRIQHGYFVASQGRALIIGLGTASGLVNDSHPKPKIWTPINQAIWPDLLEHPHTPTFVIFLWSVPAGYSTIIDEPTFVIWKSGCPGGLLWDDDAHWVSLLIEDRPRILATVNNFHLLTGSKSFGRPGDPTLGYLDDLWVGWEYFRHGPAILVSSFFGGIGLR